MNARSDSCDRLAADEPTALDLSGSLSFVPNLELRSALRTADQIEKLWFIARRQVASTNSRRAPDRRSRHAPTSISFVRLARAFLSGATTEFNVSEETPSVSSSSF